MTFPTDSGGPEDPHDQISELETRIEELAAALERCSKIALAAKAAIALGAVLLVATVLGLTTSGPMTLIGGLAAVLGGVVAYGSNTSTENQFSQSLRDAEAQRAALISRLNIRLVGGTSFTRH